MGAIGDLWSKDVWFLSDGVIRMLKLFFELCWKVPRMSSEPSLLSEYTPCHSRFVEGFSKTNGLSEKVPNKNKNRGKYSAYLSVVVTPFMKLRFKLDPLCLF